MGPGTFKKNRKYIGPGTLKRSSLQKFATPMEELMQHRCMQENCARGSGQED
jgi:hypothetical protein